MHVSAPVSMQYSQENAICAGFRHSQLGSQLSGQIAALQQLYSYLVAELTESDPPAAAAQNLSSSNDLVSVLSLYNSGFFGIMQEL